MSIKQVNGKIMSSNWLYKKTGLVFCDSFEGIFVFAVVGSMIFVGCCDESFTVCVDIVACDGVGLMFCQVQEEVSESVALIGQVMSVWV